MRVKSQLLREHELHLSFTFDRADLSLEYSLVGVVVHLSDCPTVGAPGSPALPRCITRVALPSRGDLVDLKVDAVDMVKISDEVVSVAPLQRLRPGLVDQEGGKGGTPYRRLEGEEQKLSKRKSPEPDQEVKPLVEPFPSPEFVPADPDLYVEATRQPPARLLAVDTEGLTRVATIELNPVRLTEEGLLEFSSQIDVILLFRPGKGGEKERLMPGNIVSRAQAMRQVALTRRTVINPDLVTDYSGHFPIIALGTDYLIITDNQLWNESTIAPSGPVGGDLIASFQQLAAWKRQRGLRARVVTVSEIVAGAYGDFRTGSRDLQEVIRKFLKMAQADWGVAWLLLGGDTGIIPVRWAAGGREGNVNRDTTNPPATNKSFWTGSYLRMHVHDPGVWWGASTSNLLVRPDNGLLIPYDAAGTSSSTARGWYFTTDDTYATRSATPTDYVRVNGPAAEVNADLQFLYQWNMIPTDLYYSSLVGPQYGQSGLHDWDLTDNNVYAQNYNGVELDGVNYTPTISVGRAPVSNATQADVFVNKVLAYEQFRRSEAQKFDDEWLRQIVFASTNWGGRLWIPPTAMNPPGDDSYHHTDGEDHTLIKLKDMPDWNWSLLAVISETVVRVLPYRTDAAAAGRGWYFARSSTDLSPNIYSFSLGSTPVIFPLPSMWIAVFGTAEELVPDHYIFDSLDLDGSLADEEQLRVQMRSEMPGFTSVERLYEDIQDMTSAQTAAAPLELITADHLRDALNAGPHIVSLSGHGNDNGCCLLDRALADALTNDDDTFIAYADSCLTNRFDGDSMSEHLLRNPNGGAVAYIGSTRFSWIGAGDDIQRRFFHEWGTLGGNAHLGLLFDTRAEFLNSFYWADARWCILSLNLLGDPEMSLWWKEPLYLRVHDLYPIETLRLIIDPPDPPDPPIDPPYQKNWDLTYVYLRQGEQEQVVVANPKGMAELPLTGFTSGPALLTVARAGHQPFVQEVELVKSEKSG